MEHYRSRSHAPVYLAHATDIKEMGLKPTGAPIATCPNSGLSPYAIYLYNVFETIPNRRHTEEYRMRAIRVYMEREARWKLTTKELNEGHLKVIDMFYRLLNNLHANDYKKLETIWNKIKQIGGCKSAKHKQ